MNLRQLEVLRAVMKRRTTTGAAHELGMSQPGVSNAIRHIEDQLGFLLFDRVNNRLVPTREARILFDESEGLFGLYEAFQKKAKELTTGRSGQLSILTTAELSESLIPNILNQFLAQHANVRCSVESFLLESVLDGIEAGVADIGFAMAPHSRPGLVYEPLHQMEMFCACAAGHELTKLPFVTPADLAEYRLIVAPMSGPINSMVQEAYSKAMVRFDPQIEVRFMNVAARCASAGVGVALVDALTASANNLYGIDVIPFKPAIQIPLYSILPADRPPARLAKRFLTHAREEINAIRQGICAPAEASASEDYATGRD